MKLFLSFISILFMSLIPMNINQEIEEFKDTCNNGYNTYCYLEDSSVASYDLIIVIGEHNNQVGYSIFFRPTDPNTYHITLEVNNQKVLKSKEDYEVFNAYNIIIDKEMEIKVVYQDTVTYSKKILPLTYEEYMSKYSLNILNGNNNGLEPIVIKAPKTFSPIVVFAIIFIILIVLSIIIILVLYIFKKGIFNEEYKDKQFGEERRIRAMLQEEQENIEVEVIEEEPVEVYEKKVEEDIEVRDISIILQNKGFNINYSSLDNDEKNKIMLELMKMRDFKEITQEEYRAEVIKLWM